MGSTIIPEMEINIKRRTDDSSEFVYKKANMLGDNREPKVVNAKEFDMEFVSTTTQT